MATITGTSGNDTLNGTSGDDTILGLGGNDALITIGGTDFYDGGTGTDTLDLAVAGAAGVTVNFAAGTISGGLSGTFVNIERVLGTGGADSLIGAAGNQNLSAKGGNDRLAGGDGNDTLWGGNGADSFVFREFGTANADRVSDFASGADKIVLDAAVMSALGANGVFAAGDGRFAANSTGTAQDADDRVVYNTATNQLFYDADGNGSGAAVLIATLLSGATLVATDIVAEGGSSGGSGTINGTEDRDTLTGTDGDDTINGFGGEDELFGRSGNDSLLGGDGFDWLFGEDGNDTMLGGAGPDNFFQARFSGTGPGNDVIDGGDDNDVLRYDGAFDPSYFGSAQSGVAVNLANGTATGGGAGGAGSARLVNIEHVSGTPFGDVLIGDGGSNSLTGLAGGDALDGGAGIDWLTGGVGADDFIFGATPGAANRDTLEDFEPGVDTIRLDATVMPALGPSGRFAADDARFYAADGATSGHDPDDRVVYDTFSGLLYYDADGSGAGAALEIATLQIPDPDGPAPVLAASDILVVNGSAPGNVIVGTSGPDTLTGTSGNDTINGLEGNDLFLAGSTGGNDVINGGAGRDSIEFKERATSAITVDFVAGTISGGSSGTISFTSIERILTGNFDDTLTGNGASQTLTGQSGADTLWGAGGTDTLWGGQGADAFIFREMGANADRISDFATGADKLHLDDAAFTAIGATGSFGAGDGRFVANSSGTAQDAGDRVVFNTSFGQLYYDADGSGSGAAPQLIATVQAGATVAATDIVVI